jgi:predicted site-specific integrase-resolvase
MEKLVSISEAAQALGVSVSTLRRWEARGMFTVIHTEGGHRRYDLTQIHPELFHPVKSNRKITLAYARVSSPDQHNELERQKLKLETYCRSRGWVFEVIDDYGSGVDYSKQGLKRVLATLIDGTVERLVITHKDRLLRLGAELVFSVCEAKGVEVIMLNSGEDTESGQDLAEDMFELISIFNARLYGMRSRKNQMLINSVRAAIEDVQKY